MGLLTIHVWFPQKYCRRMNMCALLSVTHLNLGLASAENENKNRNRREIWASPRWHTLSCRDHTKTFHNRTSKHQEVMTIDSVVLMTAGNLVCLKVHLYFILGWFKLRFTALNRKYSIYMFFMQFGIIVLPSPSSASPSSSETKGKPWEVGVCLWVCGQMGVHFGMVNCSV